MRRFITLVIFLTLPVFAPQTSAFPLLQWPLKNPVLKQDFGVTEFVRLNPGVYRENEHLGIDISEDFGAIVYAAADGTVIANGTEACPNFGQRNCNSGYGNWLLIWHETLNIATSYLHLSEPSQRHIGEIVHAGDAIGFEGYSGRANGSHLHFAVFEGPIYVYMTQNNTLDFQIMGREKIHNPLLYLPPLKN